MNVNSGIPISSFEFFNKINHLEFDEFLSWFRAQTEVEWADYKSLTHEQYQAARVGGYDWVKSTKWSGGYSKKRIDEFEDRWDIKFPEDYRRFLTLLGKPTLEQHGAGYEGDKLIPAKRSPFFSLGLDESEYKLAMKAPMEGIIDQVKVGMWGDNWGTRPDSEELRLEIAREKILEAPKLIPLYGHRYLIDAKADFGSLVLSVYGRDIIIYGTTLRHYLLLEFSKLLNLNQERTYENAVADHAQLGLEKLPLWGDIVLGNYDFPDDEY